MVLIPWTSNCRLFQSNDYVSRRQSRPSNQAHAGGHSKKPPPFTEGLPPENGRTLNLVKAGLLVSAWAAQVLFAWVAYLLSAHKSTSQVVWCLFISGPFPQYLSRTQKTILGIYPIFFRTCSHCFMVGCSYGVADRIKAFTEGLLRPSLVTKWLRDSLPGPGQRVFHGHTLWNPGRAGIPRGPRPDYVGSCPWTSYPGRQMAGRPCPASRKAYGADYKTEKNHPLIFILGCAQTGIAVPVCKTGPPRIWSKFDNLLQRSHDGCRRAFQWDNRLNPG